MKWNEGIDIKETKNKDHDILNVTMNSTSNMYVLIVLLMFDQIHDFGEGDREKGAKNDNIDARVLLLNPTYTATKNFIENFEVDKNENLSNFNQFFARNPEFGKIHEKIFDFSDCRHLFTHKMHREYSSQLTELLGIQKTTFENLEEKFSPNEDVYFPKYSCDTVKNLFYYYLVYSGFISTGGLINSVNVVVDAHKSKYELSPVLYSLCEFILGENQQFDKIKLVKSVATMYDAAGTQGAETFLENLENKKIERIGILKKIRKNLYNDYMIEHFNQPTKQANDSKNLDNVEYAISELEKKTIETTDIHDIKDKFSYTKTYRICYGKRVIYEYDLKIENSEIIMKVGRNHKKFIENLAMLQKDKRHIIIKDLIVQLACKTVKNFDDTKKRTPTDIMKEINTCRKEKGLNTFRLVIATIDNLYSKEYIYNIWNKFIKSKVHKEDGNKLPVGTGFDETPVELKSEQIPIYKKLRDAFIKKNHNEDANIITSRYPEFKELNSLLTTFTTRIDQLKIFLDILNSLKITESVIKTQVVSPTVRTWLDYRREELLKARAYLIYKDGDDIYGAHSSEFTKGGISQPHITRLFKKYTESDEKESDEKESDEKDVIKKKDYKFYYPYKTIGDFSQILECSSKPNEKSASIFITFDMICGHISSIFNRTILEEGNASDLFNLKTFLYKSKQPELNLFRNNIDGVMSNLFKNFKEFAELNPEEQRRLRLSEIAEEERFKIADAGDFALEALTDNPMEISNKKRKQNPNPNDMEY